MYQWSEKKLKNTKHKLQTKTSTFKIWHSLQILRNIFRLCIKKRIIYLDGFFDGSNQIENFMHEICPAQIHIKVMTYL